uniref:A1L transcription factor/late transcription factor VLTF-2 n=1 Tax=Marseillevirus LCMAC102 TaxID=2506603 RepID=A0A481YV96_9VIRU|nr:MAG: A1L transcription factor/late transcription factor VLTF-2 [Marseillevirus LCMAC102]
MPSRQKSKNRNIIILQNINAEEVLLDHYGIGNADDIEETILDFGDDDIKITDLIHESYKNSKKVMYFTDSQKNRVKYWINMIDIAQTGALPLYTTKPCWECRSTFKSHPLGCPIRYCSQQEESLNQKRVKEKFKDANFPLDQGTDFFETEGIFCTFPCIKTYIIDQLSKTKSSKYRKALTLLTLLYFKMFDQVVTIPTAGSWKLLTEWGGHLTPQELRATTGLLEYNETINIRRPYMFSSLAYIQEKRKRV